MDYVITKSVEDRLDIICKELNHICKENHIPIKDMRKQIGHRMLAQVHEIFKQTADKL